ncbi:MAG: PAS domain S-box protein, partial [Fidelibacterota bacterium]
SYSRLWRDSGVEFSRFIPGTYVTGRLLLGLFTIVAVFFEKIVNDEHTRKQTARTVIPSSIFLGVVLTFIAFIIPLPQFIYPNQFISRPVDFLSAIVFLTALILVIKRMRVKGDVFSHFLILCLLLNIGGQVYMSFSKQLFDIFFDVAHVANILSYVMPVIGLTTLMQEFNQKLVISEEKYRGIFDESIAAIYLFDKNKNFIDTNQAGLDLLGYSREELLKLNIRDVDEDPETVKPAHQTLLAGDRIINYEHNLRRKDGQIVTVLNNSKPIFDSTGNIIGLQSTIVDITDRKRMEEKFRDIFESFVDVYYRMDKDNIVTIVSPSVSEYGYTPEDVVGTKGLDLYYDIDDREDLVGQLKRSGKVNDYEIRLKDARGNPVWISVNAELIYNQAGNYQGVQAVLRNIEDRKQAEESLKRSEAKYREIATSIPGVVYQFKRKKDGSFSFPYVNEKCELYFQQKAKDLEDDPNVFFDMVPKEELPPFIASIEKSAETMREWRHDFKLSLPDDQVRWFEGRSVPEELPTGDKLWNGVVIDVTERRLALQALQESEKKFRSVVEQSNDGIYVLQNERFVFINPRFTDITGYHLDEISGEDFNFKDIVAEEGLKVLEERDERRKRGEKVPERYTFKIIRKDQEKRDLEVSVSSFAWHGETATLGTVSDVTERLKTRLELEKALEKAQIGEKVKSLFLANISHEIRTPLNGIMGFMELIEGNTNALLSEKEQDYFNLMRLNCDRLKTTVHEILDISQIEAGAHKGQTGVHRLQDLVGPVIEKHQQAADEKKLNFTWQPWSETDDYVQCDEYAISKSISYLIDNAIKYTERGFVNVVESRRNGKIILRIEDSGIGMTKEELIERLG